MDLKFIYLSIKWIQDIVFRKTLILLYKIKLKLKFKIKLKLKFKKFSTIDQFKWTEITIPKIIF